MSLQFDTHNRSVFWMMCLAVGGTLHGCDSPKADYSKVDLTQAHGVVKMDGEPLEGAVIRFEDEADHTFSYAVTNHAGEYKLKFDSEMDGVKLGRKVVRISMDQQVLGANTRASEEGEDPDAKSIMKDSIPERFNTKSELVCVVEKGKSRYDFDLESKKTGGKR